MGRYTGPTDRLSKREGINLFLKGIRSYNGKTSIEAKSNQPPGVQSFRRAKFSEYGIRLREKQKVKRIYGIREKQFKKYFKNASRMKGVTGSLLIILLERRLDNAVFRLGFGSSRNDARQLVSHKHIVVNGSTVNIPSYQVKEGDVVEVRDKSKKLSRVNEALQMLERRPVPNWLEIDVDKYRGVVQRLPEREDVTFPIEEQLIVEFYSRV